MSASQLLHRAFGAPVESKKGCIDLPAFACWMCGGTYERGVAVSDYDGASNVGQNRIVRPDSKSICEACVSLYAWPSAMPIPGRIVDPARKKGDTWRNFSVLYDDGHVAAHTKGDKPAIRAWLRAPRTGTWFAAIAESGQKTGVPWAPINPPAARCGRVIFEERAVTLPDAGGWSLVDDATSLLTAGATKEDIESGDYSVGAITRCSDMIEAFEARHGRLRGDGWFALAVWLAQRDEAVVAARLEDEANARRSKEKGSRKSARGSGARRASGVPTHDGVQRTEALGPDSGTNADRSADDAGRGGVDDKPAKALDPRFSGTKQFSLF